MRVNNLFASVLAVSAIGLTAAAPMMAGAQTWRAHASHHRQSSKNNWRNLAYGSAALGGLGLLKHNNTLTYGGAAGAAYSAWRYEQDRKSQSRTDRARAQFYGRPYHTYRGTRYTRHAYYKNGHKYYAYRPG